MDYDKELKEIEKNKKENKKYLNEFTKWLEEKKLTDKTINKHLSNVIFYINTFLNYYEPQKMKDGCYCLNEYFSDFFIRKCMWSSKTSIKENAGSIKKFYQCMNELAYVSDDDYKGLCFIIKEGMEEWLEELDMYDNDDYFW